jgi:hypothetical protein
MRGGNVMQPFIVLDKHLHHDQAVFLSFEEFQNAKCQILRF